MSILSTVWSAIKGAPKLTDDIFDAEKGLLTQAGSFLNNLHYSEAEKAQTSLDMGKGITEFVSTTLQESTAKSQARRGLARMWIITQLGMILSTAFSIVLKSPFVKDLFALTTSNVMLWGTGSIIVFYFGGYVWGTYVKGGKS